MRRVLPILLLLAACDAQAPVPLTPSPTAAVSVVATSRDGRLRATLPAGLTVHRTRDALLGTSPTGELRVYIGHRSADKVIRLAGTAKDTLLARGWKVRDERHYQRAIEVEMRRGGGLKGPSERRTMWFAEHNSGVVVCDGIALEAAFGRLDGELRATCEGVSLDLAGNEVDEPGATGTP